MSPVTFQRADPAALPTRRCPGLDTEALRVAGEILGDLRRRGEPALREWAARLDGLPPDGRLWFDRPALQQALELLPAATRRPLEALAIRIADFARAQMGTLLPLEIPVPGGRAGHQLIPVDTAGCYAPAGRYPLPSSLLMGAVTARVAGVRTVVVATPRPVPMMLAAAAIADADGVLVAGGAQAVGALAEGIVAPRCDIVVGPGNRWVTAAKQLIAGSTAIDFLAGPSELLVVADDSASPALVAADLLAQAEHDPHAQLALVTWSDRVVRSVEAALDQRLASLPDPTVARTALASGLAVLCRDDDEVISVCDAMAPEHLQLSVVAPERFATRIRHAGALFLGERSAEVFGDYGLGGSHILPTAGMARHSGGLGPHRFLRTRTWLRLEHPGLLGEDIATLARIEGLEAHARAAEARSGMPKGWRGS